MFGLRSLSPILLRNYLVSGLTVRAAGPAINTDYPVRQSKILFAIARNEEKTQGLLAGVILTLEGFCPGL